MCVSRWPIFSVTITKPSGANDPLANPLAGLTSPPSGALCASARWPANDSPWALSAPDNRATSAHHQPTRKLSCSKAHGMQNECAFSGLVLAHSKI